MLPSDMRPVDLTSALPRGVTVDGLTEPQSDGVSPHRVFEGSRAALTLTAQQDTLLAISFQPFSTTSNVTAQVQLNGRPIHTSVHPRGQYVTASVVQPVPAGPHRVQWRLSCDGSPCPPGVLLYRFRILDSPELLAEQQVTGLASTSWRLLDKQAPFLAGSGISGLRFDGEGLYHELTHPEGTLIYSGAGQPTLLSFMGFSRAGFALETSGGRLLTEQPIPAGQAVRVGVSLVGEGVPVHLRVRCEGGGETCLPIRLYDTTLTTAPLARSSGVEYGLALALVVALLLGLAAALGLLPLRPRA